MVEAKLARKQLCGALLVAMVLLFTLSSPVLAYLYRASFTVANSSSTDYTGLPVSCTADVDWLIDNGFITTATALDTRVETFGGADQLHMMADDRIMAFAPSLDHNSQLNWYLSTGNTPLASFPVIVGYGGYVTVADNASLELGDNFDIELEGYLSTNGSSVHLNKSSELLIQSSGVDEENVVIDGVYLLYNEGDYEDDWVTGYSLNAGSQSKNADHLYMEATFTPGNDGERTYVTDNAVNLTGVDTLYVDWKNESDGYAYLIASTVKANSHATADASLSHSGVFARTVESLDVSGLTGNHYIRVHALASVGHTNSDVRAYNISMTCSLELSATSIASNEYKVNVWGNSTHVGLDIDDITEDTASLDRFVVNDNANNWMISVPYFNYYKHSVGGTLIAWYQPITLISGTTLPDREGAAQNGVITWGTNPSGVTVTLGSLTAEATTVVTDGDDDYIDPLHDVEVSDWFKEPDIGVKLANHPLRPLVRIMVVSSNPLAATTEVQAWRFLGLAVLLLVTVSAAVLVRGHLLIAGLACGGVIALLVQQTIWPGWTLVFIIPAIIAGLLAERTPSI